MAIDWETGKITREQHVLHPDQLTRVARDMEIGQVSYIDADDLSASPDGSLWIKPDSVLYAADKVPALIENMYFCRAIRIKKGYIVDASAGDFRLDLFESEDTVDVQNELDPAEEGWIPIVGLIGTGLEREELHRILLEKHHIFLNKSVLLSLLEAESDDGSPPAAS